MKRLALLVLACCGNEAPPAEPFELSFAIRRLAIDPVTTFGTVVEGNPEQFGALVASLEGLTCAGTTPLVGVLTGVRDTERGEGVFAVYGGGPTTEVDPCGGEGTLLLLTDVLIDGPAYVEGNRVEARVAFGELEGFEGLLSRWVKLEAELDDDDRVDRGTMETIALVRALEAAEGNVAATQLGDVVRSGGQPDVDVDRDGLERFFDDDGDLVVDRCVDGDGTEVRAPGCASEERFQDGFELRLLFRAVRVSLR